MTPRLFGTDGIRARFGDEPLVRSTVVAIAAATARILRSETADPRVLIAGDTRASTPTIGRWLAAGLAAGGARPSALGVLPTAAMARIVPARSAAAGVVVSASHNPAADNGIKMISANGFKWGAAAELELESEVMAAAAPAVAEEPELGSDPSARDEYRSALRSEAGSPRALAGLRLALDLANGAATGFADLFETLGASIETHFDAPDGANINRGCGATHPEVLAARMKGRGLDLGFAFDGDADRAILVDESGTARDGDAMLLLWARALAARGELEPRAVVATSMSNLGLERALARDGIEVVRCGVGDREVVETLRARGLRLGGEQSGHLVDLARSTTGDGLLTALVLAEIVRRAERTVSELLADFQRYPQRILNVAVRAKPDLGSLPRVAAAARGAVDRLAGDGRLVLRYSGTEPLARVMVEAPDEATVETLTEEIAAAIRAEIGAA
ncbi:MAG TPA: phosphoglucosamine mutase [Thermoanaerobaculia bacterium]|nr:phosphoglucosamine mutase [Thermoanaerobaculia bacterium]